jgi:adenylate cyclase
MQCPNCRQDNAPRNRFCFNCGAQLHGEALIEPRTERKQATVLFADIVGSTELIANLDAESAGRRIQPVVEVMISVVERFGGNVLHRLGDGLDAIFGAPRAHDGHALLACRAALAMQEAMASLPDPTTIRIGIHSGEVISSPQGSPVGLEAQGLTLHIASRLEHAAEPGGILLSKACRDLVRDHCETSPAGVRQLRGVADPVEVFRLIGLKADVASARFRAARPTPLRGRQRELDILKQALLNAENQAGCIIGVVAESGFGKSRLCYEFGEWCRQRKAAVLEGRAHVFGKSVPLLSVLELLRSCFLIAQTSDPAVARKRLERHLLELDPGFADELPYLANFLGLSAPELDSQRIDPRISHVRLLNLVKQIVKRLGRRIFVIVLEDLHWLDELSQDFLTAMAEAVVDTHIVVVLNYRPTWSPPWSFSHFRQVALGELRGDDILHLVQDLTGGDRQLTDMVVRVAEQSAGNPFFAEELVRAVAQSGTLIGERGGYRIASGEQPSPTLPATIEAAVGARLDMLPEIEKAVLQIGAVIGKEFPLSVLKEVSGIAEPVLKDLFGHLCALDLVVADSNAHGPGYAFRHPLIQEVAYTMQLRSRRAELHAAVAKAIEAFPWGQLDEAASLLAFHYEAAGQPLEAAQHLRRAALWIGRTNSSRALADWRKVRLLLRDQPKGATVDQLRALASGRIVGFAWSEGLSADDVKPYADEALQYAREAGDRKHEALLLGAYGRIFAASAAADDYIRLARQGVEVAAASGDINVFIACNAQLSQAYLLAGLLRESLDANNTAVAAILDQDESKDGVVFGLSPSQIFGFDVAQWLRCLRTRTLVLLGRFDEAEACLATAIQPNQAKTIAVVQYQAHLAAVEMAFHRGDVSMATLHAREIDAYASQSEMAYLISAARLCQGLVKFAEQDFDQASDDFHAALTIARDSRTGLEIEARLLAYRADALDCGGHRLRAAEVAREAIAVARRRTDRVAELHGHIVAAHTMAAGDDAPELRIAEHLQAAKALLDTTAAGIFASRLLGRA